MHLNYLRKETGGVITGKLKKMVVLLVMKQLVGLLLLLLQLFTEFPSELLPVSCFVVLKPVKHILPFNLPVI